MAYETLLVDTEDQVGIIRLNRPEAMNALNRQLMDELVQALHAFDRDGTVGAIVLTGSEKAFAAGADVKEMAEQDGIEAILTDFLSSWADVTRTRKPVIAAVAGYALGGGCEVAMMCDFILAADTAKFGQPEIKIGTIPGGGGTQRLTHAIGKAKAMEMVLTGRMMDATEAENCGLVSRIIPADQLMDEAMRVARKISELPRPAVLLAKEAVNAAFEVPLSAGLDIERRLFHYTFNSADQKEGMAAFVDKRSPQFNNK